MPNPLRSLAVPVCLVLALVAAPVAAQDAPPPDRIELTNGDELTGTVKSVTADKIRFESAALGEIEIPLEEVVMVSSRGDVALQTDGGERVDGRIVGIENGNLRVLVGSEERAFPLADLVKRRPPVEWSGTVAAGGNYSTGNTERRGATVSADAERRTDDTRLTLSFNWTYQEDKVDADGDPTTPGENWRLSQRRTYGSGQFDYFLSDKLFAYVQASGENDIFKDLDLRTTVGAGLGYQLYEQDDFKLALEGGLSYVDEDRRVGMDADYLAARGAYSLEWLPTDDVSVFSDGQIFPSLEDQDDVYARVDSRLRINVNSALFTQFQWIFDWDNTPGAGRDRIDNQFFVAAGWTF